MKEKNLFIPGEALTNFDNSDEPEAKNDADSPESDFESVSNSDGEFDLTSK